MTNRKTFWRSKKRYVYDEKITGTVYTNDGIIFKIGFYTVPRSWALSCKRSEEEIKKPASAVGRPENFPGETSILYGVSLPKRIWDKIEKPYSASIAKLIERYYYNA